MIDLYSDDHFMGEALKEALKAMDMDEVPVGAVVVSNNRIIARAHNLTERLNDVTAHAEMQAITAASNYLGGKFLNDCTLYVTLEPCTMCVGGLYWARFGKVVFGASDEKRGYQVNGGKLHPKTELITGVRANECSDLLIEYFRTKRK
ncbi:MAG: nucleoside deaminase [Schleiferiaceae bacterium]|jgi:tRNA(adenine34) deaminase|nr:nucleoside deaminase [Schleiferiaceae bacterium]